MTRCLVALLVVLAPACGARAEDHALPDVLATLTPAATQDPADFPFRRAELTLDARQADLAGAISAVALQESQGGPTLVYDVTLSAGTGRTLPVLLPATSQEQTYTVRLVTEDGRRVQPAQPQAAIRWTEDVVTEWEFLAPRAYEDYLQDLPLWPEPVRRNVLLALALTALAGVAVLLIRKPVVRALAVIVIAAGATAALWLLLGHQEIFTEHRAVTEDGPLLVVRCRRSGTWRHETSDLVPLYFNAWHLRQDRMEIHVGRGAAVPMNASNDASRVRLFRLRE